MPIPPYHNQDTSCMLDHRMMTMAMAAKTNCSSSERSGLLAHRTTATMSDDYDDGRGKLETGVADRHSLGRHRQRRRWIGSVMILSFVAIFGASYYSTHTSDNGNNDTNMQAYDNDMMDTNAEMIPGAAGKKKKMNKNKKKTHDKSTSEPSDPTADNSDTKTQENENNMMDTNTEITMGAASMKKEKIRPTDDDNERATTDSTAPNNPFDPPPGDRDGHALERCEWVVHVFTEKYAARPYDFLKIQYATQAEDANVFYRATADLFWMDFVLGGWHDRLRFENLEIDAAHLDGTSFKPKSSWTWVTGDQHLSNFGAWRNRNHDFVFSVNDFDEAAIYDFQVDVLRIAVSIFNHAATDGFSEEEIKDALHAFTDTYVNTLVDYVGGDAQELYELTPSTATGQLQSFLKDLSGHKYGTLRKSGHLLRKSTKHQLEKFTENGKFIHTDRTRLVPVSQQLEAEIRSQFTIDNYGATMMKMGWKVYQWNVDFFEILDVARRVGSGIGSYGVDRYYVLLKGNERGTENGTNSEAATILDVKFAARPAVELVLSPQDQAWYDVMFQNNAERAVAGQRKLTSYVDPFTGWITLNGTSFGVRERSPWKAAPNLQTLFRDSGDFIDFTEQIAIVTATSHARGTVSKSPGQFKHVIANVLKHWTNRMVWGDAVYRVAQEYREQVLLDFNCFKTYVEENYS